MNYIIVNSPDAETFNIDAQAWYAKGVPFTMNYIASFTDPVVPGGWGCARFDIPLPANKLFHAPSVEYRYSEEQGKWLADGHETVASNFVVGVHEYFVSLEGLTP